MGYLPEDGSNNPACGPTNLDIDSSLTASTVKPAYQTKEMPNKPEESDAAETDATETYETTGTEIVTTTGTDDMGDATTATVTVETTGTSVGASAGPGTTEDTGDADEKGGISIGAIAGIAIGAVAVVGLLALGFFLVYRMGQRKATVPPPGWTAAAPGQLLMKSSRSC
jgi:cobalamin biosynthesis Mg chelatase CobN